MSSLRFSIATVLICGLGSCASAPAPTLYTLPPISQTAAPSQTAQLIGLAEVKLPAYARNLPITTAISAHQIVEDDDHRWANPPAEDISMRLRQKLQIETGASVVQRPFPNRVRPNIRLTLNFDSLLRGADGGAVLSGQYILIATDTAPEISRFDIRIAAQDTGFEAYMAALAKGLDQLAIQIAQDI